MRVTSLLLAGLFVLDDVDAKALRRERLSVRGLQNTQVLDAPANEGVADLLKNHINLGSGSCKKKNGKGKAGPYKSTCSPTVPPTGAPSITPMPSPSPSETPTKVPTTTPSSKPSATPSAAPSSKPSASPSISSQPTASPRPSSGPTPTPSALPTTVPSVSPTDMPSSSPSAAPTPKPSTSPTNYPTRKPSEPPSNVPSSSPSSNPTVSAAPSAPSFFSVPVDEEGNPIDGGDNPEAGVISTCIEGPTDETGASTMTYNFQYVMLLEPEGLANLAVMEVEPVLHQQLALEFLTCDFDERRRRLDQIEERFELLDLSSIPVDEVSSDACAADELEESDAPFRCVVVDAGFTTRMFIKASEEEVLQTFGDFLKELMASGDLNSADPSIHRLSFRGFSDSTVIIPPTPPQPGADDDSGAAGAQDGTNVDTNVGGIVGGTMAVVVAAVAALVVMFFIARRKKRSDEYLKHFEENSIYSIELDGTFLEENSPEAKARVLNDNDNDSYSSSVYHDTFLKSYEGEVTEGHDVKTCKSSMCDVCQAHKLQMPSFVRAESMTAATQRDLGPKRYQSSNKRGYSHDDTVDL